MGDDQNGEDLLAKATRVTSGLLFAVAAADAVLAPTPASKEPGFIDAILASRAVIASVRIAIVFAAAFVVLSVVALISRRQWLTRVGPVEISGKVSDLAAEKRRLEKDLHVAEETISKLEAAAADTQQVIDRREDD
ncbi:MAG TPA: hypothetical protein VNC15_02210 [Solirubrobacterales bacterium]|jgi:hypothetical protein|nr:hypothetical protein [Solirubrobacterales bacterium]